MLTDREIFIHRIADQALSEPLSINEWRVYFDRSWAKVKTIIEYTPGMVQYDTLYRIPLKSAPPDYLKKKGFFSNGSQNQTKSTEPAISFNENREN